MTEVRRPSVFVFGVQLNAPFFVVYECMHVQRSQVTKSQVTKTGVIATLRLLFARQAKGKRKLVLSRCYNSNTLERPPTPWPSLTCQFYRRKIRSRDRSNHVALPHS